MPILSKIRRRLLGMPIGRLLAVILFLGFVPALLMGALFLHRAMRDVDIADQELSGIVAVQSLKPVESFLIDLPENKLWRTQNARKFAQVVENIRLRSNQETEALQLPERRALAAKLRRIGDGETIDALPELEILVRAIGDQSRLVLDPELDSFYLVGIVLSDSRAIAHATEAYQRAVKDADSIDDAKVLLAGQQLRDATRRMKIGANAALAGNENNLLAESAFVAAVNRTIERSSILLGTEPDNVWTARRVLDQANMQAWRASASALKDLLDTRKRRVMQGIWVSLAISIFAMSVVLLFAAAAIFALVNGVRSITHRLSALAMGDFTTAVPGTDLRNDIGTIAGALQDFINLSAGIEVEREQARRDLQQIVERVNSENETLFAKTRAQEANARSSERKTVERLARELEERVSAMLGQSQAATLQMDREAKEMANSARGVQSEAAVAVEAAGAIRSMMLEMTPQIASVARQIEHYTGSLTQANSIAEDAVTRVGAAHQRIEEFNNATGHVANMLELIVTVAHQTNLLALNASIEAARAGDAGMGFMVVATEVKALAQSTSEAAKAIGGQVGAMEKANQAVAQAFGDVVDVVHTVAAQSATVARGMDIQYTVIGQVEQAIAGAENDLQRMVSRIEAADQAAIGASNRSKEMLVVSHHVATQVEDVNRSVREFLTGIVAAQRAA